MLDNAIVQLAAGSVPCKGTAIGASSKGDQDGASASGFSEILQTVFSGLNKGFESLKNGVVTNGDGSAISLDELVQQLLAGEGEETGDTESPLDMLQQMMAQLQAAMTQPVIVETPPQGIQNPEGEMFKLNVSLHNGNAAITYMSKSEDMKEKIKIHIHGDTLLQSKSMFKTDAAVGPGIDENSPSAINSEELLNKKNVLPIQSEVADVPSTPQLSKERSSSEGRTMFSLNDNAKVNKSDISVVNEGMRREHASLNVQVLPSNIEKADIVQEPAIVAIDTAEEVVQIGGAELEGKGDSRTSSEGSEAQLAATSSVHHNAYAKQSVPVKEVVHVSRLNEVSEPIMKTLQTGEKNLVIKLSPPDLGDIQITLKMNNGILTADIRVDSNAVKDMFSLAVPQIKASIEESGVKAGEFFVDLREDHYSDGGRQQDEAQQQKKQKEPERNFFDYFA